MLDTLQMPFHWDFKGPVSGILWQLALRLQMATNWTPLASLSPTVAAENTKNVSGPAPSVDIKGSFYSHKNQATLILK